MDIDRGENKDMCPGNRKGGNFMSRIKRLLLILLALLPAVGCVSCAAPSRPSAPGTAATASGSVTLSFPIPSQDGVATNQFAVWIENESGEYIKTLFVTKFTADIGYLERKDALPNWVAQSGIGYDGPRDIDAVTGATPSSGELSYTWDLTDEDGNPVPQGVYRYFVEGTLRWESRVLYTGTIDVNQKAASSKAKPQYFGHGSKECDMIGSVQAVYTP